MSSTPRFSTASSLDVVGIGNAIVDVLVQTEDQFLSDHNLSKGSMALVDEDQAKAFTKPAVQVSKPPEVQPPTHWLVSLNSGARLGSLVVFVTTNLGASSSTTSSLSGPVSRHRLP